MYIIVIIYILEQREASFSLWRGGGFFFPPKILVEWEKQSFENH
jgi:hypothetical protein